MTSRAILVGLAILAAAPAAGGAPFTPNDPLYGGYEWYGPVLNLPTAWSYTRGSPEVIVAVLDTGVMTFTPDLAGRLLAPLSATSSPTPLDGTTNHHGTWVASVLAMTVDNDIGGAGIGNFSVLPITVTNDAGNNSSAWIAAGIRLAASLGARVINVSHSVLDYEPLDSAAYDARRLGALTFVAAGNGNARTNVYDYSNLIFVSGTNAADGLWTEGALGSSWGPYVDLAAPADNILIADPADPVRLPEGYGRIDGTSFATPIAAGAAALVWSINPNLTADEVLDILYSTARDLGDVEKFGHGRVDIGAAAAAAHATLPEPTTLGLLAAGLAAAWVRRRRAPRAVSGEVA